MIENKPPWVRYQRIERSDSDYPTALVDRLGDSAPQAIHVMGETAILRNRLLGLICSIQCPGSVVIKTLDATRTLRDAGVVVAGGFHSPMEKECLDILLRGNQPVVFCPARGLKGLRMGQNARQAIESGRLLVLSPFVETVRRTSAAQAIARNNLVAALADSLWVPYAAPGGKTWVTVHAVLERQQAVFTFPNVENDELFSAGARSFSDLNAQVLLGEHPARIGSSIPN